jgi:hypothetical protein
VKRERQGARYGAGRDRVYIEMGKLNKMALGFAKVIYSKEIAFSM